jgi:hypothetical protein
MNNLFFHFTIAVLVDIAGFRFRFHVFFKWFAGIEYFFMGIPIMLFIIAAITSSFWSLFCRRLLYNVYSVCTDVLSIVLLI